MVNALSPDLCGFRLARPFGRRIPQARQWRNRPGGFGRMRFVSPSLLILALAASPAAASEPVLGLWRAENGETVSVRACGAGYCGKIESGRYKGASVGTVSAPGPDYKGRIKDPASGKTYVGSMLVTGDRLQLKGCVMEVFCKTVQTWKRIAD
jgi:uncharacterized protein (DUF2147 family)